jgi:hypothetical protein
MKEIEENKDLKTKLLLSTLVTNAFNEMMHVPSEIEKIFIDYYGEDRVDMTCTKTKEDVENMLLRTQLHSLLYPSSEEEKGICDALSEEDINLIDLDTDDTSFTIIYNMIVTYIDRIISRIAPLFTITVYFPNIRVTNEYGRFVDITKLFTRTTIMWDGELVDKFQINRSEYTSSQFSSGYKHSHTYSLDSNSIQALEQFTPPCLGSGPLNTTIATLKNRTDYTIWRLYCHEMDEYLKVESISGGPYIRLEEIGKLNLFLNTVSIESAICHRDDVSVPDYLTTDEFKLFINDFIKSGLIKFVHHDNGVALAMSSLDFWIMASNFYIKWFNSHKDSFRKGIVNQASTMYPLRKAVIRGDKVYFGNFYSTGTEFEGITLFTFKGKDVKLHIIDDDSNIEDNTTLLLHHTFIRALLYAIMRVINYLYQKPIEQNYEKRRNRDKGEESTGSTVITEHEFLL